MFFTDFIQPFCKPAVIVVLALVTRHFLNKQTIIEKKYVFYIKTIVFLLIVLLSTILGIFPLSSAVFISYCVIAVFLIVLGKEFKEDDFKFEAFIIDLIHVIVIHYLFKIMSSL